MIIEAFAVFIVLAFLFIIVGFKAENIVMQIAGFFIIALLSFTFLTGSIDFNTGETVENCETVLNSTIETYQYGNNYTGYHWDYGSAPPQVTEVNLFHLDTEYNYITLCTNSTSINEYESFTGLDNVMLGLLMLFAGLVGLYGVWDSYKQKPKYGDDED